MRRQFPNASITYLIERAAEPIVRHNPHIDHVLVAERPRGVRRLAYDLILARRLRREHFDLAIDFHGGPRSAWLTWATGARPRIGYDLPWRMWAYTTRVPWTRSLVPPRHSVENQWDLLTPLGIAAPGRGEPSVEMRVDADAARSVEQRLAAACIPPDAQVVLIHVSAGNPFRRWPADHFAGVAAALAKADRRRRIIITSGPSDERASDAVAAAAQALAGDAGDAILRCGEFDLSELRALADRAALYIGGDSGPLHVAATSNVPIVALFGPTLPERSMPWRDRPARAIAVDAGALVCRPCHQRHCVPGDFRCLTRLDPTRVLDAAETLLKKESAQR